MTAIPQTLEAIDAKWLTETLRAGGHIAADTAVTAVDTEPKGRASSGCWCGCDSRTQATVQARRRR
jgi:hypothetical protein